MDIALIHHLEKKLNQPLPGSEAHRKMAPVAPENYRQIQPGHKIACVLALLFPKEREWYVSLIQRTSHHPDDRHAGQIGFPGGQLCDVDQSFEDCALRETYEEIGVPPDAVGILGSLTSLYIPVSNYLVYPFIGFTTQYPSFRPQATEVERIFEVPVYHFTNEANKGIGPLQTSQLLLEEVPFYHMHGHKLWGATAMMMSEIEVLLSGHIEPD